MWLAPSPIYEVGLNKPLWAGMDLFCIPQTAVWRWRVITWDDHPAVNSNHSTLHNALCGHVADIIWRFQWLGLFERHVILLHQTLGRYQSTTVSITPKLW